MGVRLDRLVGEIVCLALQFAPGGIALPLIVRVLVNLPLRPMAIRLFRSLTAQHPVGSLNRLRGVARMRFSSAWI